jgi:hypothetical protein
VSIVNSQIYSNTAGASVRARARNFPSPRFTFCSLFAGRRCRCLMFFLWMHSVNRDLPDIRE